MAVKIGKRRESTAHIIYRDFEAHFSTGFYICRRLFPVLDQRILCDLYDQPIVVKAVTPGYFPDPFRKVLLRNGYTGKIAG